MRILLTTAVGILGAGALAMLGSRGPPAPPAQPIPFNHRIHAGDNHIGCTACHVYAERGPVAGIPSMARCQGCHKFVKEDEKNPAVTAEIQLLLQRLEEGKAIEWVRVHRLPDHVFFTHQRHVLAGFDLKTDVLQCFLTVFVSEVHPIERHSSRKCGSPNRAR